MSHIVVLHTVDNTIYVPSDKILMFGANLVTGTEWKTTVVLVDGTKIYATDTPEHILEELKHARRLRLEDAMR